MHIVFGDAIKMRQNGCVSKRGQNSRQPVVILNTRCELVHLYLFSYFLINKNQLYFLNFNSVYSICS
jgi:hypothetical protein